MRACPCFKKAACIYIYIGKDVEDFFSNVLFAGICIFWFINKVLLEHSDTHFYIICGCLTTTKAGLSTPQSVKYLLSIPLHKKEGLH